VATFVQNDITLLFASFMTHFKVKCPESGAKSTFNFIRNIWTWIHVLLRLFNVSQQFGSELSGLVVLKG